MSLFKSKEEREQQRWEEQKEIEAKKKKRETREKEKEVLAEKSLSYVFTISASDYARSRGRDLSDYDLRCVFAEKYQNDDALIEIEKRGIAVGAEAIVDVRPSHSTCHSSSDLFLIGTALILKT